VALVAVDKQLVNEELVKADMRGFTTFTAQSRYVKAESHFSYEGNFQKKLSEVDMILLRPWCLGGRRESEVMTKGSPHWPLAHGG
jgi:hypothetical protein